MDSCNVPGPSERLLGVLERAEGTIQKITDKNRDDDTKAISSAAIQEGDAHYQFPNNQSKEWTMEFSRINLESEKFPSQNKGNSRDWSREYVQQNKNIINKQDWAGKFNNKWTSEFIQQIPPKPSAKEWSKEFQEKNESTAHDWIKEFTENQSEDPTQQAAAAQSILDKLDVRGDPKLANSRFVAYLRSLTQSTTDNSNEQTFAPTLLQNSPQTPVDLLAGEGASALDSSHFRQYDGTGYGFRGFAPKTFSNYQFSIPTTLNPYRNQGLPPQNEDCSLANQILKLEAKVTEQPQNSQAWLSLGLYQQANEIDIQAISALYKATAIDPSLAEAWISLAASLINEQCVPDALDAICSFVGAVGGNDEARHFRFATGKPVNLNEQIEWIALNLHQLLDEQNESSNGLKSLLLVASSMISGISGNVPQAVSQMSKAHQLSPSNHMITQRLAATLANNNQFEQAIGLYKQLLDNANSSPSPRLQYNTAIAQIALGEHKRALKSLKGALTSQILPNIIVGVDEELMSGYWGVWEAVRIVGELMGRGGDIGAFCNSRNLNALSQLIDEL